jgi:hypothetical protein
MRRVLFWPLLLLALVLAACGGTAAPAQEQEAESQPVSNEPASEASASEPVKADVITGSTPETASVVRPQDHTVGASDPVVTIIEYGDFQ